MNQAERILKTLTLLQSEEQVCTHRLADIFETNLRTVQRDMALLETFLRDALINPSRGCYALQNREDLFHYLQSVDLRSFFEFIALFDEKQLSVFDTKTFPVIEQVRRDAKAIYHIADKPIEDLDSPFTNQIRQAIKTRQRITVTYTDRDTKIKTFARVKPVKIVFAEGNWYLAALTEEEQNGGFKFLRINFIKSFKPERETFHRDVEAEKFVQNFQSLFQNYKIPTYPVELKIDHHIARYFRVKKFLKSQQIVHEEPNGDLIVTYRINNEMELIPLIKKWIPHIHVLSPEPLQKQLKEEVASYLAQIE